MAARFDPPHPMRGAEPDVSPPPGPRVPAGDSPLANGEAPSASAFVRPPIADELRDELSRQASELAVSLRSEASDVDRREAQIHAQLCALEQQTRSAELWFSERRSELDQRSDALDDRQHALDERASNIDAAERFLDAARCELERRLAELKPAAGSVAPPEDGQPSHPAGTDGVSRASSAIDPNDSPSNLPPRSQSSGEWLELERAWTELRTRRQQIVELEERQAERERRFDEARAAFAEHSRRVTSRLVAERDKVQRQTAAAQQSLARRLAALHQRRAALDRMHAQIKARYREALQIRLQTERLCNELVGDESALVLRQAAEEAKRLLADSDQKSEAEFARRSAALDAGRAELSRRHADLTRQRDKLEAWYRRQQSSLIQQRLAPRGPNSAGLPEQAQQRA